MRHRILATLLSLSAVCGSSALSQQPTVVEQIGTAVTTRASGGTVAIARGVSAVSARSTLELEWVMVNDSSLKIVFDGPVGAKGWYDSPWYRYAVDVRMLAIDSIAAFEVRVLTFNIWREFTGTLSFTQLEDLRPGQRKSFDRVWGIYGESQLREHFTSIAYVARVRYTNGRTVQADPEPALRAARAIQASITLQDLQPRVEPIPSVAARP
jgi:DNA-binding transcriptional regulator YdaS (Cro superfamily)